MSSRTHAYEVIPEPLAGLHFLAADLERELHLASQRTISFTGLQIGFPEEPCEAHCVWCSVTLGTGWVKGFELASNSALLDPLAWAHVLDHYSDSSVRSHTSISDHSAASVLQHLSMLTTLFSSVHSSLLAPGHGSPLLWHDAIARESRGEAAPGSFDGFWDSCPTKPTGSSNQCPISPPVDVVMCDVNAPPGQSFPCWGRGSHSLLQWHHSARSTRWGKCVYHHDSLQTTDFEGASLVNYVDM